MFEFILIPFNNLIGKMPVFCKRNKCKNVVYYSQYETNEDIEKFENQTIYCSKYCKDYSNSIYNIV